MLLTHTWPGIDWLNMLKRCTEKCRNSMGHMHSMIEEDTLAPPVEQVADLWGLFARSRLLYGSEVWSAHSPTALDKLETVQAMAGRQILGKSGKSNVLTAAVLGDLGWMSIKSCLRLAKVRLFGRLQMLPASSLPGRQVHAIAKARFDLFERSLPLEQRTSSWSNNVYCALEDLNLTDFWTQGLPQALATPLAFKRQVKRHVRLLDAEEWRQSLESLPTDVDAHVAPLPRELYRQVKPAYGAEAYLGQGDRKSALLKFYLRSGNFGLFHRIEHGNISVDLFARKSCKLCFSGAVEDEEHFLIHCPAYIRSRSIMWLNIEGNLEHLNAIGVWQHIQSSSSFQQLLYLLGRTETVWQSDVADIIDSAVRQFILHAAHARRTLLASIS